MRRILAIEPSTLRDMSDAQRDDIAKSAGPTFRALPLDSLTEEDYDRVEIGFGPISRATAAKMKNLRWLQLTYAGVEGFLASDGTLREDFILTNATGAFGEPIAEHILSMFFAMQQSLHIYRDQQKERIWKSAAPHRGFAGSTAAIVGLGDIGLATAKKCAALGARVTAVKRTPCEKPDCVDEIYFDLESSLDKILSEADYIALCLPHTRSTERIIDARRLTLLKDNAILVNIGRGALIDQDALIAELRKDRVMAGLDVTTPEPLDADNPLWSLPNCLITPHVSGRSAYNMPVILSIFKENIERYRSGEPLCNLVDFNAGY